MAQSMALTRCSSRGITTRQVVAPRRLVQAAAPTRRPLVCRSAMTDVEAKLGAS